jgi:hypothetical protein
MALWAAFEADHAATKAGREFSRLPLPDHEPSPAFDLRMREADSMAARLRAERA